MSVEIRAFRRDDREQVADLANAHIAAVLPGASISVNTLLAQIQRQPCEFVVDPWVVERVTLVAEVRGSVVAAAHLLRYSAADHVGPGHRDAGEINWFLAKPAASHLPDAEACADALMAACLSVLARWNVRVLVADGALPAPACYGIPEQWPHIRATLERAGFVHRGGVEIVLLAEVSALPSPDGLTVRRTLGAAGTRFTADGGFIEIDTSLDQPERRTRLGGWADVGDLVAGRALTPRLLGVAAGWLRLAAVDRLLAYATPDEESLPWLLEAGFVELTRTARDWRHPGRNGDSARLA